MSELLFYNDVAELARQGDRISCGNDPNYPSKPDPEKFPRYRKSYPDEVIVIDEEQSVKWNKEEVERRNAAYEAELKRLKDARNKKYAEIEDKILEYIAQEVNLSKEKAKVIWSYAWEEHHSEGYASTFSHIFYELIDMIKELLK